MGFRILLALLTVAVAVSFGQTPAPVKAGDPAPMLKFSKIVQAGSGFGGPQSLSGQVTVLLFLRPVSPNEHAVTEWNKLIGQFAGKPVNFVWIANEKEETLQPFLKSHAVNGWMILDPQDDSFNAYGIEGGGAVLIDPRGVIAGFTFLHPEERQIQAVLDDSALLIQGEPSEEQKDALFAGAVSLDAAPYRPPPPSPPPQKPDLPPSEEVYISASQTNGTVAASGPDYWMQRGFDLKTIVAMISETDPSRVELPESFDNRACYDFVFVPPTEVPPTEEGTRTIYRHVREGIEKYFHVVISKQIRSRDVYVMTAIEGKTPPAKSDSESLGLSSISSSGFDRMIAVPHGTPQTRKEVEDALKQLNTDDDAPDLASISASDTSIDGFRKALERGLKRPIVDETNLKGNYDLEVKGEAQSIEEFLARLRNDTGLLLTPDQRSIEIVTVTQMPGTR